MERTNWQHVAEYQQRQLADYKKLIACYEKVSNLVALRLAEFVNQAYHDGLANKSNVQLSSIASSNG